jgi:hypothetical protein
MRMKKWMIVGLLVVLSRVGVQAELLYSFSFDNDGLLAGQSNWTVYSGTGSTVTNGGGSVWMGRGTEDVAATNVYAAQSGQVYLGLDVRVNTRGSGGQEYTFGFFSGANTMAGRVFMSITNDSGGVLPVGQFRLGLGGDGTVATLTSEVLNLGTTYRVVVGYNNATDLHTLWVNPSLLDEASPDLQISDAVSANVNGVFLRQANTWANNTALWSGDNLVVANDFASVVPEPGTLALMGIGLGGLAVARRRLRVQRGLYSADKSRVHIE